MALGSGHRGQNGAAYLPPPCPSCLLSLFCIAPSVPACLSLGLTDSVLCKSWHFPDSYVNVNKGIWYFTRSFVPVCLIVLSTRRIRKDALRILFSSYFVHALLDLLLSVLLFVYFVDRRISFYLYRWTYILGHPFCLRVNAAFLFKEMSKTSTRLEAQM